ncbi:MAG: SagB/ThcOx family dehydrogenase [Chloroflexota bacterium]
MATLAQKATLPSKDIKLPEPRLDSAVSIEKVLRTRRSTREFADQPLELTQITQLLWAAQGVTGAEAHRTAPSAGGLYGLELYLVAANINGLPAGIYKYEILTHELVSLIEGDARQRLFRSALEQTSISQAPAIFALAGVYDRISAKYGERGIRYTHMEAGHAAQNLLLQAVALGLAAVLVGAFDDTKVKRVLGLSKKEMPLYLIPVGKP